MEDLMACSAYPRVSDNPQIQADYEECRQNGHTHTMADMLAHAQGPGCMTDAIFMNGHCCGNQFEGQEKVANLYKKQAEAAGQNVKGKVYLSGAAKFPGDPEAWVSGRGDLQKLLEKRGWDGDGAVKVRAFRNDKPLPTVDVAPALVDEYVKQEIAKGATGRVEDIKEKVLDRISPFWSKRKKGKKP